VHHGAPPLPDVVEGEDLLHPPRPGESLGFLFDQDRAGCDDQGVVAQFGAVSQMHDVRLDVDALNWDQAELDSLVELVPPRTDDLGAVRQPERHEEQSRLVDVIVVLIDDHDLDVVAGQRRRSLLALSVPPVPRRGSRSAWP